MTLRSGPGRARIVIFAKAPVAGKVKTRLIPALGAEGAAALAAGMLARTLAGAKAAGAVELCADPRPDHPAWRGHIPAGLRVSAQGSGSLGERLARAAERVIGQGAPLLLIGTDCPELDSGRLRSAAAALEHCDAFIHPTRDGGYALLGLARFDRTLFENIAWSTRRVAEQTFDRLNALGWKVEVGETLRDVDVPADLPLLHPGG